MNVVPLARLPKRRDWPGEGDSDPARRILAQPHNQSFFFIPAIQYYTEQEGRGEAEGEA